MAKRKYRINEMLERLPVRRHMAAIRMLPKVLQVSSGTFNNFRKITIDDAQDIPYQKVDMLEQFFSLAPGGLKNYDSPAVRPINDLTEDEMDAELSPELYGLQKL